MTGTLICHLSIYHRVRQITRIIKHFETEFYLFIPSLVIPLFTMRLLPPRPKQKTAFSSLHLFPFTEYYTMNYCHQLEYVQQIVQRCCQFHYRFLRCQTPAQNQAGQ